MHTIDQEHAIDQDNFETAARLEYLADNNPISKLGRFRRCGGAHPTNISFTLNQDTIPEVAEALFAQFILPILHGDGLEQITVNGRPIRQNIVGETGLLGDLVRTVKRKPTNILVPFSAIDEEAVELLTPDFVTPTDLRETRERVRSPRRYTGR